MHDSIGLKQFQCDSFLKYSLQPEITKNSLKTCYFCISRSFKVIDVGTPENSSALLVMTSSKSVSICNFSHRRQ